MTIVRWRPIARRPMKLFNEFDRMFDETRSQLPTSWGLPLDVVETDDNYLVKAAVPGINPDDVEIIFDDNALTIKGELATAQETEGVKYHLRERRTGSFSRSLKFPMQVNANAIDANYDNGILTLTLPKAEEVKPRRINVKAS